MKPLFWDDLQAIKKVENDLREGNVVLAAGDTVFGLLADISEKGYAQLDHIKNRSKKPYLLLVGNKEKAFNLIEKDTPVFFQIEKLINICWPGPATLIFRAKKTVPAGVKSEDGNVAIRVPNHAGLLQLLRNFDALYSTSANRSGKLVPTHLQDIEESIMNSVADIILNKNESESALPSTIIDCSGNTIKIVREGAFPIEKLSEFLK
jgi:tRNA threonylcarbamoyl adenosine modification protein (Sua5/YciO/YrdC/YwlC family)